MGRDKALLTLGGKTFLELQVEKGHELGIEDILISSDHLSCSGARSVPDRYQQVGPLGGLEACLRETRCERALVLCVDTPLLPVPLLRELIRFAVSAAEPVAILDSGERLQPLIGVYSRSVQPLIEDRLRHRDRKVFSVLDRCGYAVYRASGERRIFKNVNTVQDYESVLAAYGKHG